MDGSEIPMKRSLQWRLTLMLDGAILLSGIAIALLSLILAYGEAKEFQDDILRQIALLPSLGTDTSLPAVKDLQPKTSKDSAEELESRIDIIHIPDNPRPDWLAENLAPGFYTLQTKGEQLRVFLQKDRSGKTTVVTQPTDIRDEIAINSALRILAPIFFLLPAMAWLIMRIVRNELAPVKNLSGIVDAQTENQLYPLSEQNLPEEIAPFVQAINRLLRRVSCLLEQQRRFVADAAHELRSPLTALSMQIQNLKQLGSTQDVSDRVFPLQASIDRAKKLTEQLLSLARIQTGTTAITIVDVSASSRQLIAEYYPLAEAKNIDLGLEEMAILRLPVDPDNLYLILKNALENAIKYTPAGGEITLRLSSVEEYAIFEIIDNGPGIPEAELERVFDPFYRHPGTDIEGSGLGLAIAREAAISQGGQVNLYNRPKGRGLIFCYRQKMVMPDKSPKTAISQVNNL